MPPLVLQFPNFDPVLIHLGPFAIRWYALAYIVGILLGWLYARALIRNEKLWGGPAPMTAIDFDDFIVWVTLGIILGGRIGYVLFYNPGLFRRASARGLPAVEGRHVVPRRLHRLRAGGGAVCHEAPHSGALARRRHLRGRADRLFLGRLANFINGELWGRPTDVPWAMVFPTGGPLPRHPSQLYEAALEGLVLFIVLALLIRAGALRRPGLIIGAFAIGYALARSFCELFREPDAQLGFLWGGLTMGMLLSIPLLLFGIALIVNALRRPPRTAEPVAAQ